MLAKIQLEMCVFVACFSIEDSTEIRLTFAAFVAAVAAAIATTTVRCKVQRAQISEKRLAHSLPTWPFDKSFNFASKLCIRSRLRNTRPYFCVLQIPTLTAVRSYGPGTFACECIFKSSSCVTQSKINYIKENCVALKPNVFIYSTLCRLAYFADFTIQMNIICLLKCFRQIFAECQNDVSAMHNKYKFNLCEWKKKKMMKSSATNI